MTRDEKIAQACRMREDGQTLPAIAEHFGVSRTTVVRWINPKYAEASRAVARAWKETNRERTRAYDREYADAHRGVCIRCEGPRGAHTNGPALCRPCRSKARHERCLLICAWWAQGKSMTDICAELNWSTDYLRVESDRMRAEGYDLPYRYRNGRKHLDAMADAPRGTTSMPRLARLKGRT